MLGLEQVGRPQQWSNSREAMEALMTRETNSRFQEAMQALVINTVNSSPDLQTQRSY
jgi:hypothetical protein